MEPKYSQTQVRNIAQKFYAKGYGEAGASTVKRALKGFISKSGAISEDIDVHNSTLRQRGRILYMASPVATAAVNTNRTKVVGSGLRMRCAINREVLGLSEEAAEEWENKTEAEWRMWCEDRNNCDALGLNNFYEIEQLAMKSWVMSGDVFAVLKRYEPTKQNPYTLRLHLVEADRVSTPNNFKKGLAINPTEGETKNGNKIHDGVEVDDNGKVIAYHICNVYPSQFYAEPPEWTRVEAIGPRTGTPNILHIMEAERPDQYRGVTILAPVIETLLQLRRYTEAELMAAIVQTFLTAWIVTESDATDSTFNEIGTGAIDGEQPNNISDSENEYEMSPGQINFLNPGENVQLTNPNAPVSGFEAFVKTLCKMLGAALEIPYDVLIKEFNSSYSAAKGALEEAWEVFKMRRSWFVNDFCQPTYETWLAEAIATGRIIAPGYFDDPLIRKAWSGARWDGPAQTHLDPVKEATANEKEVANGWKTNEQVTREFYGGDWSENIKKLSRERALISAETSSIAPEENTSETEEENDEI